MRRNVQRWTWNALLMVAVIALAGCPAEPVAEEEMAEPTPEPAAEEPMEEESMVATAELQGRPDSDISGTVTFTEEGGTVTVETSILGAPPGMHGFHIHETGDCSAEDFTSAGGHFNPGDTPHGCPGHPARHAGDLGNIEIGEDGVGTLELTSDLLTVSEGPDSVVGRAVILHEGEDDCVSQPTGDAGARLACGVIESG